MKVLDVNCLIDDIAKGRMQIETLQEQITAIQKSVRQVTSLEEELKGKTADAIRMFYQEAHQQFLIHLYEFLIDFNQALKQMEQAVHALEPDPNGRIEQRFIENDIHYGLRNIQNTTLNLTEDANHTIQSIRDIVSLPQLDPEELIYQVRQGEKKTHQVMEQLYDFERSQTKALQPLNQDIETMKKYVLDMEKLIQKGSFSMGNFSKRMLFKSNAYIKMAGAEQLIPYVLDSFLLGRRLQDMKAPIYQEKLWLVYETSPELKPLLDKLKNMFSYIAPLTILLYPKSLFPLTFRNHEPSNKPVNFDKLKETKAYQDLAMENAMSEEEIAAIKAHLNDIRENGSTGTYSPENYSEADRKEITFWDQRKVLGGNSSLVGTPDGLAGPAIAVADFFTEDLVTLISENATAVEKGLALTMFLPIGQPLKFMKPLDDVASGGKRVGKGNVKPVSNMNEFFEMKFGKAINNSLSKSKVKYDGQSIYKVEKKTNNNYLKKGYGIYLDALHKDHLEVIDKRGIVKYVLNLDGTLNTDKTKKTLGRVVKEWK